MQAPAEPDDPNLIETSTTLVEVFSRMARRFPDRTALDCPPRAGRPARIRWTYLELCERAQAAARRLPRPARGDEVIAILIPRDGPELYLAQLAVLFSGRAYTCLDPAFPLHHARAVIRDCGAKALITDQSHRAVAEGIGAGLTSLQFIDNLAASPTPEQPLHAPAPGDLAYVIYTSGTTGAPKGVMIEHRSITHLVLADRDQFALSPDSRVAQNSSPAYDSSIEETWLAWGVGATLVVLDDESVRAGPDLPPLLRRERITAFCPPPTLLRAMGVVRPEVDLPELRFLYVGGEALPQDLSDHWSRHLWLENGYGPTECTVTVVRGRMEPGAPVTIGQPVRGHTAHILDPELRPVAGEQVGELCLSGPGLARGYLGKPDLTAEKFLIHPTLGRIYRTGDAARHLPSGAITCLGRLDAQIKLRGYRIELEAIEACLAALPGVAAAACRLQGEGDSALLAAHLVATQSPPPITIDQVLTELSKQLPSYMVPARASWAKTLPTTLAGKLDRRALPLLEGIDLVDAPTSPAPSDPREARILEAMREILGGAFPSHSGVDFFAAGGDSLRAARLISLLRRDPNTARLAVRDVYRHRTARALANALDVSPPSELGAQNEAPPTVRGQNRPILFTLGQISWLLLELSALSMLGYAGVFWALPRLLADLGPVGQCLSWPLLSLITAWAWCPLAVGCTWLAKRLLVGRYQAGSHPGFSGFALKHWIVAHCAQWIPWRRISGTPLTAAVLKSLGAKIGERVHFHPGVDLTRGGWDLLEIGDDVTLSRDASLGVIALSRGRIDFRPVAIGAEATIGVRAHVAGGSTVGEGAQLTDLSASRSDGTVACGRIFDGVPATDVGSVPNKPIATEPESTPGCHGLALVASRLGIELALAIPPTALLAAALWHQSLETEQLLAWLARPALDPWWISTVVVGMALLVATRLVAQAILMRALGRIRPGIVPQFGATARRITLKTEILESASNWLSGTVFWPMWLRLAGAKLGRRSEISTVLDVVPELFALGDESFFADGIYLAGPRFDRGTITLTPTSLGRGTFLGNHCTVPMGAHWPDGVLIGLSTPGSLPSPGPITSWFGHPPFELPRREIVRVDRRFTHEPDLIRWLSRLFWECARALIPGMGFLITLAWYTVVANRTDHLSPLASRIGATMIATIGAGALAIFVVWALKWILLQRVQPGQHALWSSWASRWDFHYVVWGRLGHPVLARFEGTLLLPWYLRAMGMRIGRLPLLGPGFAHVVDPDMLHFGDHVTVEGQFQAHSFEDRVLKIDHVYIQSGATVGAHAVLLYGATIGTHTAVLPHSVVMKHEHLLPDSTYVGVPTQRT